MSNKTLRIIPLGGLGEIGKNMMALEVGENILVVDAGIMFPENDMLGIDYIIPDFRYLMDKAHKVQGVVLTHGHEDHIGAIAHVLEALEAPLYATPLTMGLIDVKLNRAGLKGDSHRHVVQAGEQVKLGPFGIELFHVSHSIPDCVGLGITTPAGLVVHTGDYKFDHHPVDGWPTDFGKLAELGSRGVLALLADSTNADKPGWTPSEAVIDGAFDDVFREAKGRILIGTFASLISRIAQAARAAANHGRVIAFVGTSMVENARMARKLGYLDIPEDLVVSSEQALKMPAHKVILMATGTQGEPSSILGRLSTGSNRQFDLEPGDTVVMSSHPIPGNEEMVHRTINRLLHRGASVVYDVIAPVHVSGHASQEEMKLMLQLVRPQHFIPIHGELRHLTLHAGLARQVGVPQDRIAVVENGRVIEFAGGTMRVADRIPGGYVFVDGSGVGDVGPAVMREREALGQDGFVVAHLDLDPKTGKLRHEPEILSKGFVFVQEAEELFEQARQRIRQTAAEADGDDIRSRVEKDLAKFFYAETHRRPMVFVFTNDRR
jgi:ribonuclease J